MPDDDLFIRPVCEGCQIPQDNSLRTVCQQTLMQRQRLEQPSLPQVPRLGLRRQQPHLFAVSNSISSTFTDTRTN